MTREQAIPYVSFVVDTALNGRKLGADQYAKVYPQSRLIGWQCGFEPLFVAVHSYIFDERNTAPLDTVAADDAADIAEEYLREIGWLKSARSPDYIL